MATDTYMRVQEAKANDLSQAKAAAALGLVVATVKRHWNS